MLLHTICDYLPHNFPFNLHITSPKTSTIFNINKPTIYKNSLMFGNTHILFTTPNSEELIFKSLKKDEIEYLITKINNIIATLTLPENISLFYFDQVFNKNLFKFYNNPMKITHIVSSNKSVDFKVVQSDYFISSNDLEINEMNSNLYKSLIEKELKNSLVFIKIKKDHQTNIPMIFKLLTQYANIINYDNLNQIFTINLKYYVDLNVLGTSGNGIIITDRTTELFKFLS